MAMLSRNEQETVVLSFERDYGKLLMECNKENTKKSEFKNKAKILAFEIKKTAKSSYFEDDVVELLCNISDSIQNFNYSS